MSGSARAAIRGDGLWPRAARAFVCGAGGFGLVMVAGRSGWLDTLSGEIPLLIWAGVGCVAGLVSRGIAGLVFLWLGAVLATLIVVAPGLSGFDTTTWPIFAVLGLLAIPLIPLPGYVGVRLVAWLASHLRDASA